MRLRWLTYLLKWCVAFGLLSGLLLGLFLVQRQMRAERAQEEEAATAAAPRPAKDGVVHLEDEEAERYGMKTEAAAAVQWYATATVYGRIVPNPRATAEIRSPFAGTLRAAPGSAWPALGQRVRSGQVLGWVDVRVGPELRLDLENKLAEARIRQHGAEEEVKLQESRADSLKAVTSKQILSRAELDAALIQLAQSKNQLATARAAAELWQKAIQEVERRKAEQNSPWSQPLAAPSDGEVTDLAGRPGMAVEAGALVLTLVDFRHPLVRLDFPPEILAHGGPPRLVEIQLAAVSVSPAGGVVNSRAAKPFQPLEVHLAGPAPRVDRTSQFMSYWYDAHLPTRESAGGATNEGVAADFLWRPGMQVTAMVRSDGAAPQAAVVVPARAVLFHEGRALVYVRIAKEKFQRREVRLLGRDGDHWVVSPRQGELLVGVTAGEAVVSRAAQVLLSKEFLATADID